MWQHKPKDCRPDVETDRPGKEKGPHIRKRNRREKFKGEKSSDEEGKPEKSGAINVPH